MARQAVGEFKTVTDIGATRPVGDVGLLMSAFTDGRKPQQWRLKVKVTAAGAFSVNVLARGRDRATGDWGFVGPQSGDVNGGTAMVGTTEDVWFFDPTNLGVFERFTLQTSGATGAPTVTAELAAVYGNGD
jgi:hypothetical protein